MTLDPELYAVVRREVEEALDSLLSLTGAFSDGSLAGEPFVREAFRIFHNTKGALRLSGFAEAEQVAHLLEDRLSVLRSEGKAPEPDLIDLAEQALCACVYAVEAGGTHPELALVHQKLTSRGSGKDGSTEGPLLATKTPAPAPLPKDEASPASENDSGSKQLGSSREAIRIDASRLDRLMDLGSEYLAQHARLRRQRAQLRDFSDQLSLILKQKDVLKQALGSFPAEFETFVRKEEQELRRVTQLTADFDRAMRQIRMQPLLGIVPQLRRVVSEAARELGKKVQLTVDFGDVELDREVIDALREPLMHLLRNAVDHGLESTEERVSQGKPEMGQVLVSARISGANVELSIKDDGRGVDAARVRAKAQQAQTVGFSENLTDEELMDRILFAPGFSTAREVTNLSGRGVGLDVVRSRVSELGGQVALRTQGPSAGTTFTLSVPASVVSLRGLSVSAGGSLFVIPSAHVERTLRTRAVDVKSAEGATMIRTAEGEPLRLRWLASEMDLTRDEDPAVLQVVVVCEGTQRLGLVVDEVQGDTTYVIKRLPWNVKKVRGVVGATHQGDAALSLVVDVPHFFRAQTKNGGEHHLKVAPVTSKIRILVADDSLTSRTLERNILMGAGYDVVVRDDGAAALKTLEEEHFHLLVSDVQMPVMDGLELTRQVRRHQRLSRTPIILVTSLERPDDVLAGAEAGADEYIVKGQFDQEALLKAVKRLV